ncbi:unnamed protein product [Caenorhabditis angaria]|uniref:T20D4.11-like domain-containing protein n=1 Tax=Caenorhabditis angaria TaxID=860376 RepID=A0A9P1IV39_9PELO|nr:unnamed protein product [Caenorhabditis angaria]
MKIAVLFLVFLAAIVFATSNPDSNSNSESDSRVSKYLKQCGFLNSVKTAKCVYDSKKIKEELRELAKRKDQDYSKVRDACQKTMDCIYGLKCKPAEDDNKDMLNLCWTATFETRFTDCRKKLAATKGCSADTKNKSIVENCKILKESKECMNTNVKTHCGAEKAAEYSRFVKEAYASSSCPKLTGKEF